jgi:hypothetical protein
MTRARWSGSLGKWILVGLSAVSAFGQASVVRSGSFEVDPFIGASYGIDKFRVMAGGNVTYAATKNILPYFEYSYFPGIPHTVTALGCSSTLSTPLSDIHGGVHIRLPFKESPIVPYLVFGIGVIAYPGRSATLNSCGISDLSVPFPGGADFTFNGGGGLRYYLGGSGRFGFRVEAKVYKPATGPFSNDTIGKVEAGFFFQLR